MYLFFIIRLLEQDAFDVINRHLFTRPDFERARALPQHHPQAVQRAAAFFSATSSRWVLRGL
jgi:hypothetical protein